MKRASKYIRYILCLVLVATLLLADGSMFQASAANGSITVTNALSGATLYSGDNMQDALNAAVRGSIVSIDRWFTLTSDVVVDVEVMLANLDRLTWGDYKILLTGKGAVYVDSRLRRKNYGALYSYSTVQMTEESGGYVYYLETQKPTFEGAQTQITPSGSLYGALVDEAAATIYLDAAVGGISVDNLAPMISIPAQNSEKVKCSVNEGYVASGVTLTATASNYDYDGNVTKTYTLVLLGDANGNGRIDAADANLIACHANGTASLSGAALLAADADRDGAVTAADADMICRKYVRRDSYATPL